MRKSMRQLMSEFEISRGNGEINITAKFEPEKQQE